jgi:hypothetical protein
MLRRNVARAFDGKARLLPEAHGAAHIAAQNSTRIAPRRAVTGRN